MSIPWFWNITRNILHLSWCTHDRNYKLVCRSFDSIKRKRVGQFRFRKEEFHRRKRDWIRKQFRQWNSADNYMRHSILAELFDGYSFSSSFWIPRIILFLHTIFFFYKKLFSPKISSSTSSLLVPISNVSSLYSTFLPYFKNFKVTIINISIINILSH